MDNVTIYSLRNSFAASAIAIVLSACGGGSETPTPATPPPVSQITKTGVFVDSLVAGISYRTATITGVTNAAGEYDYVEGETVTFSIGGITLGTTVAAPVSTPIDLVSGAADASNPVVINIVRLLITLDDDGDPSNGITIAPATLTAAATSSVSFTSPTFDADAQAIVTSLMPGTTLESATVAQNHFNETLKTTWGSMTWGSDCWKVLCT